jgi:hypothetical protein
MKLSFDTMSNDDFSKLKTAWLTGRSDASAIKDMISYCLDIATEATDFTISSNSSLTKETPQQLQTKHAKCKKYLYSCEERLHTLHQSIEQDPNRYFVCGYADSSPEMKKERIITGILQPNLESKLTLFEVRFLQTTGKYIEDPLSPEKNTPCCVM